MKDTEALNSYVATGSDEAFAELVARHINLVYCAALRQCRNPHLADDITQAVFIIFSKRAHTVRDASVLPGWLIRTTRYAAFNAVKIETRRRRHEHEAAAMAPASFSADGSENPIEDLTAALDEQLARLGDADRTAIVLRFSRGLSIKQIAEEMGVSADAAQKRLARAIEKLRGLFARKGLVASADAIGIAMAAQSLVAPHALLPAIQSAAQSSKALHIAHNAMRMMTWTPAKLVTGVAAAIVLGAGAVLLVQSPPTPAAAAEPTPAPATQVATPVAVTRPATAPAGNWLGFFGARKEFTYPMEFPNAEMGRGQLMPKGYERSLDDKVMRTNQAAALLFCEDPKAGNTGALVFSHPADSLRGKRIRVSGFLKTESLSRWAGLAVVVYGGGGRVAACDMMSDRPIHGDTGFTRYESVVDVPQEATHLVFGTALYSTGIVWSDGFKIEIVGNDVPVTDDRLWHAFSQRGVYAYKVDDKTRRNGHPTTMFSSTAPDVRVPDFGFYDYALRDVEKYLGKRVKVTMWLKCENVTGGSGPHLHVNGANFAPLTNEGQRGKRPLRGTTDWKKYEAIADVPMATQVIYPGITLNGAGTMWIDDVQLEIVDDKKVSK